MRSQRKFAQHFLEQTWVNKLVKSIKPQPSDLIVEIGAGRGALTLALAPSVYRLIAIEIDRGLAIRLADHLPATVLLIPDDFLLVDLPENLSEVSILPEKLEEIQNNEESQNFLVIYCVAEKVN